MRRLLIALPLIVLCACTERTAPDKTAAGTVLGAAWGAGAGAIVGNQIEGTNTGPGMAVGAGFGAVSGAMAGYTADTIEDEQARLDEELTDVRIQNIANQQEIASMQDRLDRAVSENRNPQVFQIYFDADETGLKSGTTAMLENIADAIRTSASAYRITVSGHTDDSGKPDYNERISEARARTVAAYLASRGISMDQIAVKSFGSTRPVASNDTPAGRQLNRRVEITVGK